MIQPAFSATNNFQKNTHFQDSDGFIHDIYVGNQTVMTLKKAHHKLRGMTTSMRKKGKRVLVLTDIRKLGKLNVQARLYAVDFIKDIDFDKVAVFGNPHIAEQMVNVIIMASGRGYKMKYFSSEDAARLWLSY